MAEIVRMPKLGFDMAEGTLVRWVILEGEPVSKGSVLAEIETDKATVEVESTFDGIVVRHLVEAGTIVPVNTAIAVIASPGEEVDFQALGVEAEIQPKVEEPMTVEPEIEIPVAEPEQIALPEGVFPEGVRASPLARRLARELGVNLGEVKGSGPGGRIRRKDIEVYIAQTQVSAIGVTPPMPTMPQPTLAPTIKIVQIPQPSVPSLQDVIVPMNRLRGIIGRRMVEAKQQVPHFYITHEYDVEKLLNLRQQVNELLPEEEKLSVNDFLVKATALTLRQFPNLNASYQGQQILQHGHINIGVAVAVEGGLLTVVCRDADLKPVRQIGSELRTMIPRAREGKVRPEDIEGSTFSLSNLGMYEVEDFIAIINPPEAAILAVGSARQVPVVKGSQVLPGMRMKATISVDHRVSDGAEAARFLQALAEFIEKPLKLLV